MPYMRGNLPRVMDFKNLFRGGLVFLENNSIMCDWGSSLVKGTSHTSASDSLVIFYEKREKTKLLNKTKYTYIENKQINSFKPNIYL